MEKRPAEDKLEDINMTKEDFQNLEAKVEALKTAADEAANALAENPTDASLQQKADTAEGALTDAEAELGAAVVDDEDSQDEPSEDDEHIDFEEELNKLNGTPPAPAASANEELTKAQKALFHNAKRLQDLGGDPSAVIANFQNPAPAPTPIVPATPTPVAVPDNNVTKDDMVEMEFGRIAKSEAERKVYMHHYKNSIIKTGNMTADMENAMLIANKGRILRSFGEIRRAGMVTPRAPSGTGAPVLKPKVPQASSAEATVLRRRGFKQQPDGSWKGKKYTLAVDPKTGKLVQSANK